jgi:hypothetical protein
MVSHEIRQARIQVYEDRAGKWRFNIALLLDGAVFDIVAQSSDSYHTMQQAERMARLIVSNRWEVVGENESPVAMPSPGRLQKLIADVMLGKKLIEDVMLGLVLLAAVLVVAYTLGGCVQMPAMDQQGRMLYAQNGLPQMEYMAIWRISDHAKRIAAAKDFALPDCEAGSRWVEDAGKAAGLLLLAAGIVFALARDPIKGLLAAAGGGVLYLSTVFLSEIASSMGTWVRDVVPWIMTAGLLAGIGALVYAGWHYRAVVTGLIKGFEVQKELIWSEHETEIKVKSEQGPVQKWISRARKQIIGRKPCNEQ